MITTIDRVYTPLQLPIAPELPLVPQPALPLEGEAQRQARNVDDAIKAQVWPVAYAAWLAGGWKSHGRGISEETRRAYGRSITDFRTFIGDRYPMWRVMGSQVINWQNAMRAQGLSETTINLRISGLSSLFEFLCHRWPYPDPRTRDEAYLVERNPCRAATRTHIDPYDKADGMTRDEMLAMLRRINQSTLEGLRDYALVSTYLATAARSTAIAALRWGDIKHPASETDVIYYEWTSKGKHGRSELLRHPYLAICKYLAAAGRLETMGKDDFIFTPLSDIGTRLAQRRAEKAGRTFHRQSEGHLTGARINTIIKNCARRAGLDESRIHTHIMRHTAADLFLEMGGDMLSLQEFLHHSSLSTTRIYITRRKERTARHPLWKSVGAFFEMV